MFFALLTCSAAFLTGMMYLMPKQNKSVTVMGFSAGVMWFLAGGQAITLSTATWDMYFLAGFAFILAFGVGCCIFGSFALRESGNEIDDKEGQAGEEDAAMDEDSESKSILGTENEESRMSKRTRAVRKRAENRRTEGVKPKDKTGWGEFG